RARPMVEPVMATCRLNQKVVAAPRASRQPRGCATKEEAKSARAACAKAVVMPQVGQGELSRDTQVQGWRPSCSCVPCPRSAGWGHAARARTESMARALRAAKRRSTRSARTGRGGDVEGVGVTRNGGGVGQENPPLALGA